MSTAVRRVFDAYEIEPAERLSDGRFRPVWRLILNPPVKFIRPEGAPIGELPIAKAAEERERDQDGDIEKLHRFLAVPDMDTSALAIAWVLDCYALEGDKPVAAITGANGSGKTTDGRVMCALVDPLPPPQDAADGSGDRRGHMRAPTSDPWDCALAAQTTWVQPFDNISEIDDRQADTFCRFSTGGGIRRRSLYGLLDETTLSARRPVLFTAVEDLVVRDDLASRSLFLRAGRAPDVKAVDEVRLWQEFEAEWPALLGCVFDAVSVGLANQLPDMARPAETGPLRQLGQPVRDRPGLGSRHLYGGLPHQPGRGRRGRSRRRSGHHRPSRVRGQPGGSWRDRLVGHPDRTLPPAGSAGGASRPARPKVAETRRRAFQEFAQFAGHAESSWASP